VTTVAEWVPHNPYFFCTCGSEIVGTAEAHCPRCHQTFATVADFEYHAVVNEDGIHDECIPLPDRSLHEVTRRAESNGGERFVWSSGV
jgi:hypothetical protein